MSFGQLSPRQWVALVVALLFLAGAAGYFVGARESRPPDEGSVDVGFLQDMITHHEQAIEMALIEVADGAVPDVQAYDREILVFQSYEIGLMDRQLDQWGYERADRSPVAMDWMGMPVAPEEMPGMASEAEMDALADASGRDVDALFIQLMQDHHAGGRHMAEYAADHASSSFVRDLAARIGRNQRIEVGDLEAARERADLPEEPPGYGT
jgi:uncharacterized protein (DUF305 family)